MTAALSVAMVAGSAHVARPGPAQIILLLTGSVLAGWLAYVGTLASRQPAKKESLEEA